MSIGVDSRDPKRVLLEQEEKDHGIYYPKLHTVPARAHSNLHANPCVSPKSSHQFIYPYNGSSSVLHTSTNSHHPLEALRRHHHAPPIPTSSSSYSATQRSSHTPTPHNACQGQRTPKTPETPGSPQLGPHSSLSPSSTMIIVGNGRATQTHAHHPHGVIVGGSPISSSPSISPSVHNMNCVSPHQRSCHLSTSPSPLSEGGGPGVASGGGLMGSNVSQRRKSTSSSPHSPLSGGSPNPSPLFPKYKLEDILEQFKNSGNNSTNNHHLFIPTNLSLLTYQSSSNPHAVSSKPSVSTISPSPSSGPPNLELNSGGPSGLSLGPLLNQHHSHQSKLSNSPSFPASCLLSAAAKAQLANQIPQAQSSNVASKPISLTSSIEVLKDMQHQPSLQVTNSTLNNNYPSSSIASIRPPNPSLASTSSILFPSSHSLAQSLPHLPSTAERNTLHRKKQRRSPTVLSMRRDTQQLPNGQPKTPPRDAVSATAINLSTSSSSPSTLHSSSTSAVQIQNAVMSENPLLPGHTARLPAPRQLAQLSRPSRQNDALDFTTHLTPAPLGLDPPTQPLSALLHLLSVQNAQATTTANSARPGPVCNEGGAHTNKQSPGLLPPSPNSHSNVRHLCTQSPCPNSNTNPILFVPQQLSPPPSSSQSRLLESSLHPQTAKSSSPQRGSHPLLPNSSLRLPNSSSPPQHMSPPHSEKQRPTENHVPTVDCVSQDPLQENSPNNNVAREIDSNSISTVNESVDLSQSQGTVSVAVPSSPKPLDLSNNVLALLAASSTVHQGEGSSNRMTDVVMSSQENPTAGKDIF